jgi:NAD(P)H-dependent FMN reductase
MSQTPHIGIVSSSLDSKSRSAVIARLCLDKLTQRGVRTNLIDLRSINLARFDNDAVYQTAEYAELYSAVASADGLILCTPIYNWSVSAELKKLIEATGSTPPDGLKRGAWFDKVITFAGAAGLPHSYMAFSALATTMMLDFKCVINPYHIYVHNRHWTEAGLTVEAHARVDKALLVMLELATLLATRSYTSDWEL